jgi:hypothetical protein
MNTPAGGVTLPELDRTAPERIWLQINPDGCASERDEPFPYGEEVTWCQDSVGGLQVEYVRADLARAALAGEWRVPELKWSERAESLGVELFAPVGGLEHSVGQAGFTVCPAPFGGFDATWWHGNRGHMIGNFSDEKAAKHAAQARFACIVAAMLSAAPLPKEPGHG